jgi:formate-dependent nitrite reductase membrane component NrfD
MSIGSWTLFAFGGFSGLAALGHVLEDVFSAPSGRVLARAAGVPAALSGALLATYTGTLLSATSTPLWAAGYKLLPALFGASGTATATAALSLVLNRCAAPHAARRRVERLALAASCLELVLTLRLDALWKREQVAGPLEEPPLARPYRFGVLGLGILAPLGVHALQVVTGRELHTASLLASVAALVGGYTQRAVMIFAGERSAERPRDYFRIAQ